MRTHIQRLVCDVCGLSLEERVSAPGESVRWLNVRLFMRDGANASVEASADVCPQCIRKVRTLLRLDQGAFKGLNPEYVEQPRLERG